MAERRVDVQILWKTDESTSLPFSLAKRDFPCETAVYVLANKLGCADGKYSGGRYMRWARQFNRQYSKILRRLLITSDGLSESFVGDGASIRA